MDKILSENHFDLDNADKTLYKSRGNENVYLLESAAVVHVLQIFSILRFCHLDKKKNLKINFLEKYHKLFLNNSNK